MITSVYFIGAKAKNVSSRAMDSDKVAQDGQKLVNRTTVSILGFLFFV